MTDILTPQAIDEIEGQLRLQARENLDPDYTKFMERVADIVRAQAEEIERLKVDRDAYQARCNRIGAEVDDVFIYARRTQWDRPTARSYMVVCQTRDDYVIRALAAERHVTELERSLAVQPTREALMDVNAEQARIITDLTNEVGRLRG